MGRDQIVQYVQNYAQAFDPNIKEGVVVYNVQKNIPNGSQNGNQKTGRKTNRGDNQCFHIKTSIGDYTADQVVVATGGYHRPKIPRIGDRLPSRILQLHSSEYKNPESLPDQGVLVIGTGQSGCQIAEDLHIAGKQVHLCVGGAPRSPRAYRGKDVVDWLHELGFYNIPIDEHPQKETVRTKTNHYVTGRGGGREIDLRQFATEGMKLYGKLAHIEGEQLTLKNDLKHNLDQADNVAESIKRTIDKYIEENNIQAPTEPSYKPVWEPTEIAQSINLQAANIGTVIWATGYHMDFSWIDVPAFDGKGYPGHQRGVTTAKGLYFIGLPWLYTWGSGRFSGVAQDAEYLANRIALQHTVDQHDNSPLLTMQFVNEFALGS